MKHPLFLHTALCVRILVCLAILVAPLLARAEPAVYTRSEQIDIPQTLPKAAVWEVLRTRLWLHALTRIKDDLVAQRHISGHFSDRDLIGLAAITHTFAIREEERGQGTVTAHLTVTRSANTRLRAAATDEGLLSMVLDLIQEADDRLRTIDSHWPKGHIYTEPLFAEQKHTYETRPWTRETWEKLAGTLNALFTTYAALEPADGWFTNATHLSALEEANQVKEHDPLLLMLLAECRLRSQLPQQAVASASHALRLNPHLERARYIRALAYWQLKQLGLAENDLTVVLAQAPLTKEHASHLLPYLRARGGLRLLLGKHADMCADFTKACQWGDCDGLKHARAQELCN